MASEQIECASHGKAWACFACAHLVKKPAQPWFSNLALPDNPYPDAWCQECETVRLESDGWENVADPQIKLICSQCYIAKRAKSANSLKGKAKKDWQALIELACSETSSKQEKLIERFDLSRHERWDYDQATGLLVFSNDGIPAVEAKFQIIGSISKEQGTWQWAWSNPNWVKKTVTKSRTVADFGFERGYPMLTVPRFDADEHDGWHLAMLAVHVMRAKGIYRIPGDNVLLFLAITQIKRV
jgi:hypothetical protein